MTARGTCADKDVEIKTAITRKDFSIIMARLEFGEGEAKAIMVRRSGEAESPEVRRAKIDGRAQGQTETRRARRRSNLHCGRA